MFSHDIQIETPEPIHNCINVDCGEKLSKYERSLKSVFCLDCLKEVVSENFGGIISTRGMKELKKFQQKISNHGRTYRRNKDADSSRTIYDTAHKSQWTYTNNKNHLQGRGLH